LNLTQREVKATMATAAEQAFLLQTINQMVHTPCICSYLFRRLRLCALSADPLACRG
jgi:hypothetical protein